MDACQGSPPLLLLPPPPPPPELAMPFVFENEDLLSVLFVPRAVTTMKH